MSGDSAGRGTHKRDTVLSEAIGCAYAQQVAAAAHHDGLRDATIVALAALGSHGKNPQNCERDFHRRFGGVRKLGFHLEPWWILVPLLARNGTTVQSVRFPVLAPHELFATICGPRLAC